MVEVGAFPNSLRWCAPLLVDSFTAAGAITSLWLSLTVRGAARTADAWYARLLIAAGTAASLAINVAHAPAGWAPRLVAGIPPVALLLAVELLLSLARRTLDAHVARTLHDATLPVHHPHTQGGKWDMREAALRTIHRMTGATPLHAATGIRSLPAPNMQAPGAPPPSVASSVRARVDAAVVEREVHGDQRLVATDLAAELNANLGTVRNALRAARRAHGLIPPRTRATSAHATRPPP